MRLIDADTLKAQIDQEVKEDKVLNGWAFFFKVYLDDAPTIDAVEVVHGKRITEYDGFDFNVSCSLCGEEALIKEGGSHDHAYSNYCPNCGAKMDGEEKNDE